MAVLEVPVIVEVVTPGEILEVEEMLRRMFPERGVPTTKISVGSFRFLAWATLAEALALVMAAYLREKLVETMTTTETTEERRKRRAQLCVFECLRAIDEADQSLRAGYGLNRALETGPREKYRRKFPSRA